MKVLAIHRFYWPDTPPYASMLRAIVRQWVSDGHEVDVLSSQPSYKSGVQNQNQPRKDVVDGANVTRLNLPSEAGKPLVRIFNAMHLGVSVFWQAVIRKRYDVIMVSTSPPVLAGWFVALAAKLSGARFIYHCMDIHPEIGRISGDFRNPRVFSLLSWMDGWTCGQARPVVVLSEDMTNALATRKAGRDLETLVINNFSLPSESLVPEVLPFPWPSEPFVLLFAGNIGRFQGLDVLIDAMGRLSNCKDIHLVMMGEGTEKDRLVLKVEKTGARVSFVGHHSVEIAKKAMGLASSGFVSLVPELYRFAYPSKTMTYLEQGCPILVAVEPESCLAKDIVAGGAGVVVPSGNIDQVAEMISSLAEDPVRVDSMSRNARALAVCSFAPDIVLAKWSFLLKKSSRV